MGPFEERVLTQVLKPSIKYILPSPLYIYSTPFSLMTRGILDIMVEPAMKKKKSPFSIRNPLSIPLRKLRMQVIANKKLPYIRKTKHKRHVFME